MADFIDKITDKDSNFFFISPHLDDAILSAGGLISYLSKRTKIRVITLFTKASLQPYNGFARNFTHSCGYEDADRLFSERCLEDKKIFNSMGITDINHLGFIDAAWRKKEIDNTIIKALSNFVPEVMYLYPTRHCVISGKILKKDLALMIKIEKKLKSLIPKKHNNIIFCPLGIGRHIDHIITRNICLNNFANIIYWSDFPYSQYSKIEKDFIKTKKLKRFIWKKNLLTKKKLILGYKTQLKSLFSNNHIPIVKEYYYQHK